MPAPSSPTASGSPVILCINGGSSSLKYALYRFSEKNETSLCEGSVLGMAQLPQIIQTLSGFPAPHAIGHRVVHGGPRHQRAARIDAALIDELKAAIPFAPLHLPPELEAIEATLAHFPAVPQVVCFDTAFHRDLPEVAQRLPLPRPLFDRGIKRYGFHGLSYEYVVEKLGAELGKRAVIAHLGGGSSLVALCNGAPIDTSMGLTPSGGVMMATRTGDLDPGIIFHLLQEGMTPAQVEHLVNRDGGFFAVSGESADMKVLLARCETDARARMAVEMYCYQVKKHIGAFAAALGGLDSLVFTGGIGEHAAPVRQAVCAGLEHLGVEVDPARNAQSESVFSRDGSRVTARVVPTNEQLMIARRTQRVLSL